MTTKPMLWVLLCTLSLACILSSCQSSKIAYGNSHYFKQTPKPVAKPQPNPSTEAIPESDALYVTIEESPVAQKEVVTLIEKARHQLIEVAEKSDNKALKEKAGKMNHLSQSINEGNLSKKEMRSTRKELRKEMRSLVKEYRAAPEEMNAIDKTLRLSLILAGVGLLFLLIGGVAGYTAAGGVLALLGLLALIGGLVVFIIWAINESD